MALIQKIKDINGVLARHYSFAAIVGAAGAVFAGFAGFIDELPESTIVLMALIGFIMTGVGTLWMSVDFFGEQQSEPLRSQEESENKADPEKLKG